MPVNAAITDDVNLGIVGMEGVDEKVIPAYAAILATMWLQHGISRMNARRALMKIFPQIT